MPAQPVQFPRPLATTRTVATTRTAATTTTLRPGRRKLIALDQDLSVLRQIADLVSRHFTPMLCRDPLRALAACETDRDVVVIVTEHVITAGAGLSLLETIRTRRPDVRRIMLTSYSDLATIVEGLHTGAIQQLVRKPIDPRELLAAVGVDPTASAQRAAG